MNYTIFFPIELYDTLRPLRTSRLYFGVLLQHHCTCSNRHKRHQNAHNTASHPMISRLSVKEGDHAVSDKHHNRKTGRPLPAFSVTNLKSNHYCGKYAAQQKVFLTGQFFYSMASEGRRAYCGPEADGADRRHFSQS